MALSILGRCLQGKQPLSKCKSWIWFFGLSREVWNMARNQRNYTEKERLTLTFISKYYIYT